MTRRVVVTGMGGVTSLGNTWDEVSSALRGGECGISYMAEWEDIKGLNTKLGGAVQNFHVPQHFTRKQLRTMGRVAKLAACATEDALASSGLKGSEVISNGRTGVAFGSSTGSVDATLEFGEVVLSRSVQQLNSTSYIRMMPHTTAVNLSVLYQTKGRIIPTSCACVSGSLAIGYAYENIKHGYQDVMLAGGADELDATEAAVFDVLYATSTRNECPPQSSRPFDAQRDGLVIGEGAGTLILEELEHAQNRQANIIAEIVGFGHNSDGNHVTQPAQETMEVAMRLALQDAGISSHEIGYVSAHAAATLTGDPAESHATKEVLGERVPVSSLKGNFGHILGACGAVEAWVALSGWADNWFPYTLNLSVPDSQCADIDYIIKAPRRIDCEYIMSNNFAFGGMNTSLVFKKFPV